MATRKPRTFEQIQAEIESLQAEAAALKAAEVKGVIERIRAAIDHYGLTAADLGFGRARARLAQAPKPAEAANPKPRKAKPATKPSLPAKAAKTPPVFRFQDGAGHQWTGNGPRPKWFVDALASGKTANELRIPTSPVATGTLAP